MHGIVTQHGGALNVRERPGAGSTFEVYLAEHGGAGGRGGSGSGRMLCRRAMVRRSCLVDDEAPLVLLGEEMLAALGYEPVGHAGSHAALSAFRANPERFDLALLDEIMPETTGSELAVAIHEIRPDLPIVLMTGYRSAVPAHRLTEAGIREVLAKPLRSASLADCLARHLSAPARLPAAVRR